MGRKKSNKVQDKVRVTVALSKDVYEIFSRIKALSGGTISKHVSDFLSETSPALRIFVQNMEIAKGLDEESKKRLKEGVLEMESSFQKISNQAVSLTKKASKQMDILEAYMHGKK